MWINEYLATEHIIEVAQDFPYEVLPVFVRSLRNEWSLHHDFNDVSYLQDILQKDSEYVYTNMRRQKLSGLDRIVISVSEVYLV